MAIWTFEQGTGGNVNSFDFPLNVKSGSALIAATAGDRTVTPATPVDSLVNTWNILGTVDDTTNSIRMAWWYAISNGAGANSITFTNMSSFDAYLIAEFSVDTGTISLDTSDSGNLRNHLGTTDNITSGTISTAVTDELIVGLNVEDGSDVVLTEGTGFVPRVTTNLEGVVGNPVMLESKTLASPGSVAATFTADAAGTGAAFVAAFKTTAGAVTVSPYPFRHIMTSRGTSW